MSIIPESYHARSTMKPHTHEHKGIAYFDTFEQARDFGGDVGRGFPAWHVVPYERGWAVQTRPSGDYFSLDGLPCDAQRHDPRP